MTSRKLGKKLYQMTNQRDHGVGRHSGIRGVLYSLFCDMMADLNIDLMRWSYLLNDYVKKQARHFQNRRDMTSIRGNLNKEFTRDTMTWKVFCKAMMFLQVVKFTITIEATYANGRTSKHSRPITFNTVEPYLNSDENGDGEDNETEPPWGPTESPAPDSTTPLHPEGTHSKAGE